MRQPAPMAEVLPPGTEPPAPRSELARAVDGYTAAATISPPDDLEILPAQAAVFTDAAAGDVARQAPAFQRLRTLAESPAGDRTITEAWSRLRTNPQHFVDSPEEMDRLRAMTSSIGERLRSVDESLETDPTGRISRAEWTDDGLRIETSHPVTPPRPQDVSFNALSEHVRSTVSQLAALALQADEDLPEPVDPPSPQDIAVLLGVPADEADELPADAERLASEVLTELAPTFGVEPAALLQAARSGWERLRSITDDPFVGDQNPVRDAVLNGGRPRILNGKIDSLPLAALEGGDGSDTFTSIELPDGRVALAAPGSIAERARHLTPGIIGTDGRHRWVSTRPRPVVDPRIHSRELSNSQAPFHTFVSGEIADHPALDPRDVLVFSLPDDAAIPQIAGAPEMIGRANSSTPKYDLSVTEIPEDRDEAKRVLESAGWALLPASSKSALKASGFSPVDVPVTVDGEQQYMLFTLGVPPHQAEEFARDRGSFAAVNDGIVLGQADEVQLSVRGVDISVPPRAADITDTRESKSARRVQVPADVSVSIEAVASAVEAAGGHDLELYTSRQPDGWDAAHVEVASDGVTTTSALYRDGDPASAHGGRVYVRNASSLPSMLDRGADPNRMRMVDAPSDDEPLGYGYTGRELVPILTEGEMALSPFLATVDSSGNIRPSGDDAAAAVHLWQDLTAAGVPGDFKLVTEGGTYRFS